MTARRARDPRNPTIARRGMLARERTDHSPKHVRVPAVRFDDIRLVSPCTQLRRETDRPPLACGNELT